MDMRRDLDRHLHHPQSRAWPTAAPGARDEERDVDLSPERREELARTIREHREDAAYPDTCICETEVPDHPGDHFAHHLADAIAPLIAGWLAAEREASAAEVRAKVEAVLPTPYEEEMGVLVRPSDIRAALDTP